MPALGDLQCKSDIKHAPKEIPDHRKHDTQPLERRTVPVRRIVGGEWALTL